MATIDMTHRKINFPPRFLPYLEKHRIFELLHECIELLIQVRPRDHISFLKAVLPCAAMKKDKQRIVFFSPPLFDRQIFAELIADCLGIQVISRLFLETLTKERKIVEETKIQEVEESVEEESCICPEEGGEHIFPMYFPAAEEPFFMEIEEEPEVVEEEEVKEPCVCVCPCVKEQEEAKKQKEQGLALEALEKEKDIKLEDLSEERVEDEIEGERLPCEPRKKKHRKPKKLPLISPSETETIIPVDIDYGLLAECDLAARGWILQDFPTTGEEGEKLSAIGVIPTHALRIIVNEEAEEEDIEYKWLVRNWMKAYKFVPVMKIKMGERTIENLSKDLCKILSIMPHRHAPMLPRLVLIGSRGSGVTTQAKKLAKKYGMVHVEFEIVIARVLQQEDELSKLYKHQLNNRPDPELEAFLLEKVLLTSACRNRGWILTGYPRNIDQLRMLDIIATPPNRIIFIEVPPKECFVRLYYRKIDPCLGDEYKLPKILPAGQDSFETSDLEPELAARLLSHPKNNKQQILHDIETYFTEKKDMMSYCGKTASYINGDKTVDSVFENIEQILINPAPAQPPRDPFSIKIGVEESLERLKKFRLASGMFFNNLFLNPPENFPKF